MAEKSERLTVYGANWCGDCRNAKKFLGEQRIHYRWVDITDNDEAIAFVESVNEGKRRIPTMVLDDGGVMSNPSHSELAKRLGLETEARMAYYDVIIVGGGPAGLTAAFYLSREGLEVLVIEKGGLGGQAGMTDRLDNFPGFPEGVSGSDFADRLAAQARKFGVELLQAQDVTGLRSEAESHYVTTAADKEYGARAIVIASGSTYQRLGVPGEDDLIGAGVHFCATCDGPFYRDQEVVVIGGGNSAAEESLFLTRFADRVTMLVRGKELKTSPQIVEKIQSHPKIDLHTRTEVTELKGNDQLSAVVTRHRDSGETLELKPAGAFVFIGLKPNSTWLPAAVKLDAYGFVDTDRTLETNVAGVFAAGDVRQGATAQAASAAGEGATVALMVREYLKDH